MNNILIDKIVRLILMETEYGFVFDYKGMLYCKSYIPSYPMIIDSQDMSDIENFLSYVHSDDFSIGENDIDYINYNYGIDDLNIIKAIWNKYYIVLYTKIKDEYEEIWKNKNKDNSLNESTNREEKLIDRVVESLLADTTYQVYHRFMGEIVCNIEFPMFVSDLGYTQREIETFLNELIESNRYNWKIPLGDYKYLDRNYGITDETIIKKIYFKYHIILFTGIINAFNNYQSKPINESTNREEKLIEYVSNNLYEDTKYRFMYDYDDEIRVIITWPTEDGEQDFNIWDMEEWDVFYYDDKDAEYLDKHYGITGDMVQRIFDAYIQKLAPVIYKKMEYLDNNREES